VNTPFIAIQHLDAEQFRISASGIVLELDFSFPIMKKLKLVGEPFKIFKNTAFIKNMFNSDLEVTRFEGAKIKTVSGIRGMVKRALTDSAGPPGSFRATFDDMIVLSDIVFLRSYYGVQAEAFYNPIVDYEQQRLLKTTAQVRNERNLSIPDHPDSEYHEIVRTAKDWGPIRVPRKLEAELPFKSKPKPELPMERDANEVKALQSDRDRQIANFLRRLGTVKNQRVEHEQAKNLVRQAALAKVAEREEKNREEKQRERIKRRHARSKG
jgi:ribosome biogenesis protein BMS1